MGGARLPIDPRCLTNEQHSKLIEPYTSGNHKPGASSDSFPEADRLLSSART